MMTRTEHLLVILTEECAEVAHRASKALRFGLLEKEPGQDLTNSARLAGEIDDLWAAVKMLRAAGAMRGLLSRRVEDKREKVESFLAYSAECGTLLSTSVRDDDREG